MGASQDEKARKFRALHAGPEAFIIPNPWDQGSARILAALGFQALATTSAGYAFSLGRRDGAVGREAMLAHCRAIVARERASGLGRSRELLRRSAGGGGRDGPFGGGDRPRRLLGRGREWRSGASDLRPRPCRRAGRGGGRGGARAALSLHAHGTVGEFPPRATRPRGYDPAPRGLRGRGCRRALCARLAEPGGDQGGVRCGRPQAGQRADRGCRGRDVARPSSRPWRAGASASGVRSPGPHSAPSSGLRAR